MRHMAIQLTQLVLMIQECKAIHVMHAALFKNWVRFTQHQPTPDSELAPYHSIASARHA
jgi:hypothetical protein